jgi:hypothetical protein
VRLSLAVILLAGTLAIEVAAASSAWASGNPPPPPPPGPCNSCPGPPPPPTPVPTLGTPPGTTTHTVSVQLSPTHVRRGHATKLAINASASDSVTAVLRYRSGKPTTYRAKIGKSGKLTKIWKISKKAPLGRGKVQVSLTDAGSPYKTTVSFTVTK